MNALLPGAIRFDIQTLAQAVANCKSSDALHCQFSLPHWTILGAFLQPFPLSKSQILIEQGARDCTLYFIESGTLSAHSEDENAHIALQLTLAMGSVMAKRLSIPPKRAAVT